MIRKFKQETITEIPKEDLPDGIIKRFKRGNAIIDIKHDPDPIDPRKYDGLIGVMACSHPTHKIGDVKPDPKGPNGAFLVRALYLDESDGLEIYMGEWPPTKNDLRDPQTSMHIGYIYTTIKIIKKIYGVVLMSDEEILEHMIRECMQYTQYLRGNTYAQFVYRDGPRHKGEWYHDEVRFTGYFTIYDAIRGSGVLKTKPLLEPLQ